MYLFYDKSATWEIDYITKTIFKNISFDLYLLSKEIIRDINYFRELQETQETHNIIGNCIYVFSSNPEKFLHREYLTKKEEEFANNPKTAEFNKKLIHLENNNDFYQNYLKYECNRCSIINVIKYIKPKIIVNLSDEGGKKAHLNYLSDFTELYLRCYYHIHYPLNDKSIHIPLGYISNMFNSIDLDKSKRFKIKKSSERYYKWSFIGNIKNDRIEMVKEFRIMEPNILKKCNVTEMKKIYRNSIFVPIGRGWVTLDCLRIYEALLCGAIPVITGSPYEIENTFGIYDEPPFIFSNSWNEALIKCQKLLKNKKNIENLEKIQKYVLEWWWNYIDYVHKRILSSGCY